MRARRGWVLDKFAELGFADAHLEETADGSRAVVGSRPCSTPDAPTVLLYAHYDVQPPLDDDAWRTPPFELTEKNGRWFGRGTADCKGNIVVHLAALRALGDDIPVNLKLVVEGSEEQGTGGLEAFVPDHADLLRADAILVCDTGNAAVGHPAATVSLRGMVNVVVTVEALGTELHSGMFGGPAPDALAALVAMLASLRDEQGNTTIEGLDNTRTWSGEPYPPEQFRSDATVLDGVVAARRRHRLGHAVGASGGDHPGHRLPSGGRVGGGHRAEGGGAAQPADPAGDGPGSGRDQPDRPAPGRCSLGRPGHREIEAVGAPFKAEIDGPAYTAMASRDARGVRNADGVRWDRAGPSRCATCSPTPTPGPRLILIGVEEPLALIHAPNESVDPSEIENMALTEARFLQHYATMGST